MQTSSSSSSATTTTEVFVPPINFAMLCPGVYRSGYPTKKNFRFLRALNLRSICYLCPEEYAQTNLKFCEENGVNVLRFPMEGNKEPFVDIPENIVHRAMSALCDRRNHPVLIHCNKGKHRTGTICGCLRKVQGWSLVSIFDEYLRFAGDKARVGDQQYIELYRPIVLIQDAFSATWMERTPTVCIVSTEEEFRMASMAQLESSPLHPEDKDRSFPPSAAGGAAPSVPTSTPGIGTVDEEAARKAAKKEAKKAAAAAATMSASTSNEAMAASRTVAT